MMRELRGFPVNIIVKTENIQGEPAHGYFIGLLEHIANITHSFHGAGRGYPSYLERETPGSHHGRNLRGEALGSYAPLRSRMQALRSSLHDQGFHSESRFETVKNENAARNVAWQRGVALDLRFREQGAGSQLVCVLPQLRRARSGQVWRQGA